MLKLNDREWKTFKISSLFKIVSGKDAMLDNNLGNMPYVNSSGVNNGITQFVNEYKVIVENCITIARTGTVGATFYQKGKVAISGNIRALIPVDFVLNRDIALFLIQTIKNTTNGRFSYGKILGTERITNLKIFVPITSDGQPDYAFMEQYIKEREDKLKQKYIDFIGNNYKIGRVVLPSLEDKEWGEFFISDICYITSGRDIYDSERIDGDIPYITSTASNNGIKYYVSNTNETLEENAISVNRNGSVGYSFYHKYKALYSNDCRKLKLKQCRNEFVALFITNQITQQKDKYNYGYKMGTGRLKKQMIMLPITDDKSPDYEYMEQYIKAVMFGKYKKYLEYVIK